MNRQVDIKALVSHIVRGDGLDKCRICMGDTTDGQVYLGDTVMMEGDRPVTLAELLEIITGIEVTPDGDMPDGLCNKCTSSTLYAANFRDFCQQAFNQWDITILQLNNLPMKGPSNNICVQIDKDHMTVVNDFKARNVTKKEKIADIITHKLKVETPKTIPSVLSRCECPECGKQFKYPHELYLHLKESMDNKHACYICAKIMSRDELISHLKMDHAHQTYDCKKCSLLFRSQRMLERHLKKAHSHGACTCGDCGRTFKSQPAYYAHLSVHSAKTCPRCDKIFLNQTCYYYHVKKCCKLDITNKTHWTKHKVLIEVRNKANEQKTKVGLRGSVNTECICDYCGKTFAGKRFVAAHIQIVHLKNTHRACQYCGKYLASAHMGEHLKKHEVELAFNCEHCGIILKSKTGYTQHIRLHTGERPYKCSYCDESFSAASRRSEHIRKKHKSGEVVLKYACEQCPAKFSLPFRLRKHVESVHDHPSQLQFSCAVCQEKFSSCRGLTNHNKRHQSAASTDFKLTSKPVKEGVVIK